MQLTVPSIIVFLGFVGKLQAEVRLHIGEQCCGLALQHEVARGCLRVFDEKVFNPATASLFLSVETKGSKAVRDFSSQFGDSLQLPDEPSNLLLELQHCEANEMLVKPSAAPRLPALDLAPQDLQWVLGPLIVHSLKGLWKTNSCKQHRT